MIDLEATMLRRRRGRAAGGGTARRLLNAFSPGNGWMADVPSNTLFIADPITPANNYDGPLIAPATGLFNKLTFTRASAANDLINGVWTSFATNVPRIATPAYGKSLLMEGARTNLFLNSGTPATQGIATTAQIYTLSFKGTGSITLTGASTAGPLVGTGADNRVELSFTPSAGTVTFTLAGQVLEPQFEIGAMASSYVATAGAGVARAIDVMNMPATLFNLPAAAGTLYMEADGSSLRQDGGANYTLAVARGASIADAVVSRLQGSDLAYQNFGGVAGAANQWLVNSGSAVNGRPAFKWAHGWATNDVAAYLGGAQLMTDAVATIPAMTSIDWFQYLLTQSGFVRVKSFGFFGQRVSNANMAAMTA